VPGARPPSRPLASPPRHDLVGIGLAVFGIYNLALGLLMVVVPGEFFRLIGPFGARNDHYTRDNATFGLAIGIAALIAVRRERWRVPVLIVLAVQFSLHAVNHLVDIDVAHSEWAGPLDFALITLGAALASVLALRAAREQRGRSLGGRRVGGHADDSRR